MIRYACAALAAAAACSAHAAVPLQACDNPTFATVLHPAAQAFEARAIWLDRRLAQWPGVAGEGVFRLYHSPGGAIKAAAGAKVGGAAGSLLLDVFAGAVPAAAAQRFKYVGAGAVLSV